MSWLAARAKHFTDPVSQKNDYRSLEKLVLKKSYFSSQSILEYILYSVKRSHNQRVYAETILAQLFRYRPRHDSIASGCAHF